MVKNNYGFSTSKSRYRNRGDNGSSKNRDPTQKVYEIINEITSPKNPKDLLFGFGHKVINGNSLEGITTATTSEKK
ncbi:MAG: hypothetical protein PVJ67_01225 [Candidatus Pacearchaeota archaeon]|jgi:hypothetical protein